MDYSGFLSLLVNQTLYFRCIAGFEDPWEAALPSEHAKTWAEKEAKELASVLGDTAAKESADAYMDFVRKRRMTTYANCWHMNEGESAAMWKLYGNGIAIESAVGRLIDSLERSGPEISIAPIKYINYRRTADLSNYPVYLTKRQSFEHEQELRAFILDDRLLTKLLSHGRAGAGPKMLEILDNPDIKPRGGIEVQVDLGKLMARVLTPNGRLVPIVRSVLEKYGHPRPPVLHADIDTMPL
jgi:hypothetical protein